MAHFTHIIKLHRGLLAMIISSRQKLEVLNQTNNNHCT